MRTIAVIPARFHSKRLPGKPLVDLLGKTMVERVYERTLAAKSVDDVLVATDDERILRVVEGFGGNAVLTSRKHQSGSDRIAEAVAELDAETIVNVQGDEPLLSPDAIDQILDARERDAGTEAAMLSLMRLITEPADVRDPNVVKVVTDARGYALYFSRAPIPYTSTPSVSDTTGKRDSPPRHFEHIGIYVYPKPVLLRFVQLEQTELELVERLEQLRALAYGIPIRMVETEYQSLSVDTPEDLERARARIASLNAETREPPTEPGSVSAPEQATLSRESHPMDVEVSSSFQRAQRQGKKKGARRPAPPTAYAGASAGLAEARNASESCERGREGAQPGWAEHDEPCRARHELATTGIRTRKEQFV